LFCVIAKKNQHFCCDTKASKKELKK